MVFNMLRRIVSMVMSRGWRFAFYKVFYGLRDMVQGIAAARHFMEHDFSGGAVPDEEMLVSVLVPVYAPPLDFLRQFLDSAAAQTYANWELCLADGSPSGSDEAGEICRLYAVRDPRIQYKRLSKNLGIAGNSNACAAMAHGEYLLLADQDDLLHPCALQELMAAAQGKQADFIYADEAVFSRSVRLPRRVHWKQDFALPDLLANNYICHPAMFRAALFRAAGGFRAGFDGSQDHELFLRLTSQANRVVHVPQVLYFWRSHAGSVASGIGAKDYARAAGQRAVESFLQERGIGAVVEEVSASVYRVQYALREPEQGFSVILPCRRAHIPERLLQGLLACPFVQEVLCPAEDDIVLPVGVIRLAWAEPYDYAAMCRAGFERAQSPCVLFLQEEMEPVGSLSEVLRELLSQVQQPDVRAVGSLLLRGRKILSAGYTMRAGGFAAACAGVDGVAEGYMRRLLYTHAVAAAGLPGLAVRREAVYGLSELFASGVAYGLPWGCILLDVDARWQA